MHVVEGGVVKVDDVVGDVLGEVAVEVPDEVVGEVVAEEVGELLGGVADEEVCEVVTEIVCVAVDEVVGEVVDRCCAGDGVASGSAHRAGGCGPCWQDHAGPQAGDRAVRLGPQSGAAAFPRKINGNRQASEFLLGKENGTRGSLRAPALLCKPLGTSVKTCVVAPRL